MPVKLKKFILWAAPLVVGGLVGFVGSSLAFRNPPEYDAYAPPSMFSGGLLGLLIQIILVFMVGMLGFVVHIVLHEAGHLIAGKLSGYGFVSFRVGRFTVIKKHGKYYRKTYDMAGTGGQCLLSPPDVRGEDFRYPFMLYNLGGGLVNVITGIVFLFIGLGLSGMPSMLLNLFAVFGIILGLSNLIPLTIGGVPNDGNNILALYKHASVRRSFWIQLKFAALITQGERPRDMPEIWGEDEENPTIRYAFLTDKGLMDEARAYAQHTVESPEDIPGIYKNELRCELLFHELIKECRNDVIETMYTEELQKHIKASASQVSKQRLLYAYHLLYKKDANEAEKNLAAFKKACANTPFEGEVPGENEMLEMIESAYAANK